MLVYPGAVVVATRDRARLLSYLILPVPSFNKMARSFVLFTLWPRCRWLLRATYGFPQTGQGQKFLVSVIAAYWFKSVKHRNKNRVRDSSSRHKQSTKATNV